jgi:hypothetical protein
MAKDATTVFFHILPKSLFGVILCSLPHTPVRECVYRGVVVSIPTSYSGTPSSNLDPDTRYPDLFFCGFPRLFQAIYKMYLIIQLLPHPSQFIIHNHLVSCIPWI